ncbi:MAG: DUF2116 family Zn-ribbon domain-containing protein [Nitrososphaeria archaeon]
MSEAEEKRKRAKDLYIPPHSHCKVCGKAIPEGQIYCSRECREKDLAAQRRERNLMWGFYALFIGLLVVTLIITYVYRP